MSQLLSFGMQTNSQFDASNLLGQDRLICKIPPLHEVKNELRYATKVLTEHKLYHSAKWTGELLLSVSTEKDLENTYINQYVLQNTDNGYRFQRQYIENYDLSYDKVLVAKNLFDLREFKKCAHLLKEFIHDPKYQSALFFYYYSLYMVGEIRKEEEIYENGEGNARSVVNSELQVIDKELERYYIQNQLNEINLYLYGLVLKEQQKLKEAKIVFLKVLNNFPSFWSAWLELCKIIDNEDFKTILFEIKDHWMKNFFLESFCLEKFKITICVEVCYGLQCFFRTSNFLANQIANAFYNNQDFDLSLDWFEKLQEIDPFRFENMDTYSNILYIKENQGELANLALRCFYNNKYTPETCCVVGNYYSLMGDHFKAIVYFRKALKLERNCLAAWTLIGHEYLEMKNIAGAIEAYRNAVEIDSKDFRAWYGLGQTYELQNMNHYALYYFTRAVISRPKDARMWNAMGSCYEKLDKKSEALKCFERAENCKDKEGITLHKLGKLYNLIGFEAKAVSCFEENLKRKDEEQIVDKELGECLLFLARFYKKTGDYEKALIYSRRLFDFNGPERDEANNLIFELNAIQK